MPTWMYFCLEMCDARNDEFRTVVQQFNISLLTKYLCCMDIQCLVLVEQRPASTEHYIMLKKMFTPNCPKLTMIILFHVN